MKLSRDIRIVIIILVPLLITFASGHAPNLVRRECPDRYSTWGELPVGVYIGSRDLFRPTRHAMHLLNKGFGRRIFVLAGRRSAEVRVDCVDKLQKDHIHGYTEATSRNGHIENAQINILCKSEYSKDADDEIRLDFMAHELYHALGFVTPGLGHSYYPECISYPIAREGQMVCDEMMKDFNERYPSRITENGINRLRIKVFNGKI